MLVLLQQRCPSSVRLSVTLWYCIKTNTASVTISSPTETPETLVFAVCRTRVLYRKEKPESRLLYTAKTLMFFLQKNQVHREIPKKSPRASTISESGEGTNWQFAILSCHISEMVQDMSKVAIIKSATGSCIRNQWITKGLCMQIFATVRVK